MKAVRKYTVFILAVTLLMPTWLSPAVACVQAAALPATEEAAAAERGHHGSAVQHAHPSDADSNAAANHYAAVNVDEALDVDTTCPCCGDCVDMCLLSGCSTPALIPFSPNLAFLSSNAHRQFASALRVNPTPHPLFRPPAPNAN